MSFKSEAANVRAGISSGNYKKKSDPFAGFFEELSYGIKKKDEEKRQEERIKRQEARAIGRATKAKQDAEDKLERDRESLANFYLTSTGNSPTPQNRTSLMSVIKGGNFTDFGSLEDHMKQYSTYNAGTPQADIDAQMENVGLLQEVDGPFQAKTDEVNSLSSDGTIEFTGKKPEPYDTGELRENNWEGELQREISANGENSPNALAIRAWAVGQRFFTVAGRYTQQELMALPITGDGTEVGLDTILNTTSLTETERKIVTDIQIVKKAEKEDANIMNDMYSLILKPINELQAYVAVYKEDTKFGKNAREALSIKQAIDSSDNLLQSSRQLDKDVSWYDAAIASVGKLDQTDTNYKQNVKSLENLMLLRSLAVEKVNADDLEAEMKLSTKERFLRAKYKEEGFFVIDPETNTYKIPDSNSMAIIETTWKKLTDITDKPDAFSKDKLLNMDVGDLKTIIDTGMLSGRPDELALVNSMYESRVGQADATKLSKDLDPTQQNFTSTTALDVHLAGLGSDRMTPEALASFVSVRSVLAKAEGAIADEKDIDVYQMALRKHLELPNNKGLSGQEFIDMVANWETTWKDTTAKTTEFKPINLYKDGDVLVVDSAEALAKAETDNWDRVKLGDVSQIMADLGIDRRAATLLDNKLVKYQTDKFNNPVFVDLSTGVITPIKNINEVPSAQVNEVPPAQEGETDGTGIEASIGGDGSYLVIDQNGVTESLLTKEQLDEASDFLGLEGKLNNLNDLSAAFGATAFGGSLVNRVAGIFGSQPASDAGPAMTVIDAINTVTTLQMVTMFPNIRDSVALKQELKKLTAPTGRFFFGKPAALDKVRSAMAVIESAIRDNQEIIKSRTIGVETQSKSRAAELALSSLLKVYGIMETALKDSLEPEAVTVSKDSSIFKVDPVVPIVPIVPKYPTPGRRAISLLRETPSLRNYFDELFGPGAADLVLTTSNEEVQ